MNKPMLAVMLTTAGIISATARNPFVANLGLNDPHIPIFGGRAYVFASHDRSMTNMTFVMDDWWIRSSPDLVHWTNECVIKPEQTLIRKPFAGCWAADAACRHGKYLQFISDDKKQPFFSSLALYNPHAPCSISDQQWLAPYRKEGTAFMINVDAQAIDIEALLIDKSGKSRCGAFYASNRQ